MPPTRNTVMKTPVLVVMGGLIIGGALVHGAVTQRWAVFAPDPAQTDRLHAFEVRFQDWQPTVVPTEMPTNERSTATARSYQSASTGRSGVVTIISGIPGSVSTHTPDVCYVGSGYRCLRGPKKETIELAGRRGHRLCRRLREEDRDQGRSRPSPLGLDDERRLGSPG